MLFALTAATLEAHGIPHAIIGATALAVHGVTRATADIDLLATDLRCLPVDVIVGRSPWQAEIIARALPAVVAGTNVPIAQAADVVLLKLYAGGDLPQECTALWQRIVRRAP